jgi:P-type conjugative transfer protein TrbJ
MRPYSLALLLLLGTARPSASQWAVIDGSNLLQNTTTAINSVATAVNTAQTYIRQGEQIVNEYNLIRNQIV